MLGPPRAGRRRAGRVSYVRYPLGAVGGSPSFDPTQLSGLTIWMTADTYSVADGAAVGSWANQPSSGSPWPVNTGTPVLRTSGINSRKAVEFAGNAFFKNPGVANTSSFFTASSMTLAVTFIATSITVNGGHPTDNNAMIGDDAGYWSTYNRSSGPNCGVYGYDGSYTDVEIAAASNTPHLVTYRHVGGVLYGSIDGGAESSTTSGNLGSLTGNVTIGRGYSGGTAPYFTGRIREIVGVNRGITTTELASLVSYMKTNSGL